MGLAAPPVDPHDSDGSKHLGPFVATFGLALGTYFNDPFYFSLASASAIGQSETSIFPLCFEAPFCPPFHSCENFSRGGFSCGLFPYSCRTQTLAFYYWRHLADFDDPGFHFFASQIRSRSGYTSRIGLNLGKKEGIKLEFIPGQLSCPVLLRFCCS